MHSNTVENTNCAYTTWMENGDIVLPGKEMK